MGMGMGMGMDWGKGTMMFATGHTVASYASFTSPLLTVDKHPSDFSVSWKSTNDTDSISQPQDRLQVELRVRFGEFHVSL
ncbi:hypothetical protein N7490_004993 [Penicillium lividum]|nr:hypothetical protein N7490_004993 [Penicillium lividum]